MLSNIAVFCPVMAEPITMTYISAVIGLDLHTLQEKSISSPQEKGLLCRTESSSSIGLGGPHMTDPNRSFLVCLQVCFWFVCLLVFCCCYIAKAEVGGQYLCSPYQLDLLQCIYLSIHFLISHSKVLLLDLKERVLLNINNIYIGM